MPGRLEWNLPSRDLEGFHVGAGGVRCSRAPALVLIGIEVLAVAGGRIGASQKMSKSAADVVRARPVRIKYSGSGSAKSICPPVSACPVVAGTKRRRSLT